MKKRHRYVLSILSLTVSLSTLNLTATLQTPGSMALAAAPTGAPASLDELKADKLKTIIRQEPRAQEVVPKVEARLERMRKENPNSPFLKLMEDAVNEILMTGNIVSDVRRRADVDLLEAIAKEPKAPTTAELAPLQERYKKLCEGLDDVMLNKDLDRLLHIHDKFVRYTSLGLWAPDKIASELERMETLLANAPDIAYGKAETLNGLKDRRLAAIPKLCYLGLFGQEENFLTNDRRSVGVIEEYTTGTSQLETTDHVMQGPNGELIDITQANHPLRGIPFSPPLSLWMKSRMMEGRVPAITFKLADSATKEAYKKLGHSIADDSKFQTVNDVAQGKLDDYFKKNSKEIIGTKIAAMVGFLSDFDQESAARSFGEDGRTPYYFLLDPKLKDLSADKLNEELEKRIQKGIFNGPKGTSTELCDKYGKPDLPDGPERIADSFKRIRKILTENGGTNVCFYSSVGAFHGNKNATKYPGNLNFGNQAWNKLDYYYPGDGIMDWLGIAAYGVDPAADPKGPNIMEAIEPFMVEARGSSFSTTPVMIRGAAPSADRAPFNEAEWIATVFNKIVPATFPNISIVFVSAPKHLTLWSRESISAYRTNVGSNKFYKWPLRFKMLPTAQSAQPAQQATQ